MAAAITAAAMTATVTAVINHQLTRSLELWGHFFKALVVALASFKYCLLLIKKLSKSEDIHLKNLKAKPPHITCTPSIL